MTLRLVADENLDGDLLRALQQRAPALDVVRVQEVGLAAEADPVVLEWAAASGRVLLTHDYRTMPRFAYDRVQRGLPMAGVVLVPQRRFSYADLVDHIILLSLAGGDRDLEGQVVYLPL